MDITRIYATDPTASLRNLPEVCGCGAEVDGHQFVDVQVGMIVSCCEV